MYTQCPECSVAFSVSVDVLKQAAGQVRCGSCGSTFNALEHLSDEPLGASIQFASDTGVPELTPDSSDEDGASPEISAEENAALLKTLDHLAATDRGATDTGSLKFVLQDDEPGNAGQDKRTPPEEMRFDDNTPLPDDFDFDSEPAAEPVIEESEPPWNPDDAQVSFALGDPDEWRDLLGEVAGESDPATDDPPDVDTQFDIQAEAMGIDISGVHKAVEKDEPETPDDIEKEEFSIDHDLIAAAFDVESAAKEAADELIPELTEEEKTLNKMIDEDLLAMAAAKNDEPAAEIEPGKPDNEDDGSEEEFEEAPEDEPEEPPASKSADKADETLAPHFETIIMEGEVVRGEHDPEKEAKNAGFMAQAKKAMRERRDDDRKNTPFASREMIAAIVVLALLLVAQVIHTTREALATMPVFNNSIGPIYRSLGRPVTPAWNISGWRFEATKGSTDEGDELLTIYSRVGNNSDQALPYPLVHVSLTDRFDEIIGSRVMDPGEYLVGSPDPSKAVEPGETFNAVIAIASPAPEATGFKLNVCYRMTSGQLRCAIEDFK